MITLVTEVAAVHLTATGVANNHGFWILHSVFNFCPKITTDILFVILQLFIYYCSVTSFFELAVIY